MSGCGMRQVTGLAIEEYSIYLPSETLGLLSQYVLAHYPASSFFFYSRMWAEYRSVRLRVATSATSLSRTILRSNWLPVTLWWISTPLIILSSLSVVTLRTFWGTSGSNSSSWDREASRSHWNDGALFSISWPTRGLIHGNCNKHISSCRRKTIIHSGVQGHVCKDMKKQMLRRRGLN